MNKTQPGGVQSQGEGRVIEINNYNTKFLMLIVEVQTFKC